jgi:hypothetical protein
VQLSSGHSARTGIGVTSWRANTARHSEDWNIDFAKRLRNRAFARAFLLAAIDEGLTVQ